MNHKAKWLVGVAGSLLIAGASPPSRADEKGAALMKEVEKATLAVKTLSGELQSTSKFGGQPQSSKGVFRMKRPNLLYAKMTGSDTSMYVSNGKNFFVYMPPQNQYMKMAANADGKGLGGSLLQTLFFNQTQMFGKAEPNFVGTEAADGVTYNVVELVPRKEMTIRLYVSPEKLVTRVKLEAKDDKGNLQGSEEEKFVNLKINAPIANTQFAFLPPKGAKLYEQPSYDAKLLPVKSKAPEFNLATPQDGRVSLATTLKEKKAVLVNFWFYG